MILQQQLPHPRNGPLLSWLALHSESLTLALCEPHAAVIRITPISYPSPIDHITNVISPASAPEDAIAAVIRHHMPGRPIIILPLITNHPAIGTLPDYLLLNSLDGTTPAILHTQHPVALYFADPKTSLLGPAERFRSSVDLTPEGWAYWWEDAQRAFQKLTIEFMQATNMPVPTAIAEAVKHD